MASDPRPQDDPLWKDPINNPQREHDPVTDPNVNCDPDRRKAPTDVESIPDEAPREVPEADQPTPLSDERR